VRVTRFEVAGDVNPETRKQRKSFRQFTPDGRGDWKPGLSGLQPPLYRLTALQAAPAGSLVYVVEGEAKAELLRGWALTATTSIMGAEKFRPEHADELSGHDIVILPDNDDAGRKHCALVAGMLTGKARTVKVLELPGLQHKGDVIDWQRAGGTAAELARLTATIGSNGKHHGDAETPFSYGNENSPSLSTGETAIEVRPGQLHILATEGEAALCSSGLPIFQRGHSLVQPVTTEVPASNSRTTIASGLAELTLPAMLDKLSQAATWEKWNARRKAMVACDPPDNVAKIILSRAGFWHVPPIAGIITAPTLRPDGTILEAPGYDAATRLFHAVDPALRRLDMPQRPTRIDADRALVTLKELLTGFPFCTTVDIAVALSAMITPVLRGAMDVAPMHALRAPTAGTGKSFFVDLVGVIATGQSRPKPLTARISVRRSAKP
jgi:putative DNA primase/helicase